MMHHNKLEYYVKQLDYDHHMTVGISTLKNWRVIGTAQPFYTQTYDGTWELSKVGQSIALHAFLTARNSAFVIFAFKFHHTQIIFKVRYNNNKSDL